MAANKLNMEGRVRAHHEHRATLGACPTLRTTLVDGHRLRKQFKTAESGVSRRCGVPQAFARAALGTRL
jgi:hypothetical protein